MHISECKNLKKIDLDCSGIDIGDALVAFENNLHNIHQLSLDSEAHREDGIITLPPAFNWSQMGYLQITEHIADYTQLVIILFLIYYIKVLPNAKQLYLNIAYPWEMLRQIEAVEFFCRNSPTLVELTFTMHTEQRENLFTNFDQQECLNECHYTSVDAARRIVTFSMPQRRRLDIRLLSISRFLIYCIEKALIDNNLHHAHHVGIGYMYWFANQHRFFVSVDIDFD
jgi:hypothetical protein